MKKYGQVVAKLRKQNGFTQEQLGKLLNVSSQAISKWENNQSEPDLATIEKITEIFNIKISDFFDMANSEETTSISKRTFKDRVVSWYKNLSKKFKTLLWSGIGGGIGIILLVTILCVCLIPKDLSSDAIFSRANNAVFRITVDYIDNSSKHGTGFFIDNQGTAVISCSLIDGAVSGEISIEDKVYSVESVLGVDKDNDIAIIKIDIPKSKSLKRADGSKIQLADKLYAAIVSSDGEISVVETLVSKVNHDNSYGYIQLLTSLQSGTPIFNTNGRVVAVVTSAYSGDGNMATAIPLNVIDEIDDSHNISLFEFTKQNNGIYQINFDANGGMGEMESQVMVYNYRNTLNRNTFFRPGYSFDSWEYNGRRYDDCASIYNLVTSGGAITLKARWKIVDYSISYVLDGGTNSEENPSSYNCEQETIILENPQKLGYDFVGWYETSNFSSQPITEIQANSYKSYVLYAKFDIINYQLDYVMNGGTNNELNPSSFTINDFDIYLLTPTKANHTFVGWFLDPEFTQEITMISTDITAEQPRSTKIYACFLSQHYFDNQLVIYTSYDLQTIMHDERYKNTDIILGADIDLNGQTWEPVNFSGGFDGNGHTISNYDCHYGRGFFGTFSGKYIKNLTLTDFYNKLYRIDIGSNLSSLASEVKGTSLQPILIENCHVLNGSLKRTSDSNLYSIYAGSLIGYATNCEIKNCYADVEIEIKMEYNYDEISYIGGLVGYMNNSSITNSYTTSAISVYSHGICYMGGMTGYSFNGELQNSYTDNVMEYDYSFNEVIFGGLIGKAEYINSISGCFTRFTFTDNEGGIQYGWLVGEQEKDTSIENSFVSSDCILYEYSYATSIHYPSNDTPNEEIWAYVSENWDTSIWEVSLSQDPTLKSLN